MADITPIGRPAAAPLTRSGLRHEPTSHSQAGPLRDGDSVELSNHAQLLSRISQLPDVRQGLVDQVRAAVADGSYETPDKIDAVVSALAEELA